MKIVRAGGSVTLPGGKNSAAIYDAILAMDDVPENYTMTGSPRVEVLEEIAGKSFTEEERDLIWEAIIDGDIK